ncbi:MAG TPA: hypothetical protein VHF25_06555 [Nitriliruptorales bacterium]|nr:hypothetical protein [Nitriliruptorales bacterium]
MLSAVRRYRMPALALVLAGSTFVAGCEGDVDAGDGDVQGELDVEEDTEQPTAPGTP